MFTFLLQVYDVYLAITMVYSSSKSGANGGIGLETVSAYLCQCLTQYRTRNIYGPVYTQLLVPA